MQVWQERWEEFNRASRAERAGRQVESRAYRTARASTAAAWPCSASVSLRELGTLATAEAESRIESLQMEEASVREQGETNEDQLRAVVDELAAVARARAPARQLR